MQSATELKNRANNKLVSSRSFSSNKNLYTYFPHNMCNLMLYVAEECECEKNIIYLDSTMIQWNEVNGTRKDVLINICHVIYDTKLYCRECGGRSFLYISFFFHFISILTSLGSQNIRCCRKLCVFLHCHWNNLFD